MKIALIIYLFSFYSYSNFEKIKNSFFIPLTYPDSEWSQNDFGKQLPEKHKTLLKSFKPIITMLHSFKRYY